MKSKDKGIYRPTLRIRVRRTLGFVLGLVVLGLLDLRYHFLPKLTGRLRKR
ncbi:MAG: hypothetical protein IBX71_04600 [Candidatus Desulforudis sp.]|nr:hypothetical protein [Desulforudis sp.]